MSLKNTVVKFINVIAQNENASAKGGKAREGMPEIIREAASSGAVLLKNNGALPFERNTKVSLFGRVQNDWFYTGYGSGGDVNKPYAVNLIEGVRNCEDLELNEELASVYEDWCEKNPVDHGFWGHWPRFYPEMPLESSLVKKAKEISDCAVVVIGRSSGEDRENVLEKGSYYATDEELDLLKKVTDEFENTVVVFNIGSVMDFSFLEKFGDKISSVLIAWQGGMESGNALCDLLSGKVTPSGKLSDTIVKSYEDYPSAKDFGNKDYNFYTEDIYVGYRYFETFKKDCVLYPFGFGLSYTNFDVSLKESRKTSDGYSFNCEVKNIGEKYSGALALQLYIEKPCGELGNPFRELAGFKKTKVLLPSESEEILIEVPKKYLSSYDDSGKTGNAFSYVIEKGVYGFALGEDVRRAKRVFEDEYKETEVIEKLSQVSAPKESFNRLKAVLKNGAYAEEREPVTESKTDLKKIILSTLPKEIPQTGDRGIKLSDVKSGKNTMDEFVAQLSFKELEALSRGDYKMRSKLGAPGNAGCFGGVLPSLRKKGIPAVTTSDGPSGLRLFACCSLIPIGTLLSCSFDEELTERLLSALGEEMKERGSDVILAPGMNIHRNPLCGRNFEYYSEDPVLSGKIASSYIKGIQGAGVSACPKHFACNNQEFNRIRNNSILSERALREIYLRGFEIAVKEGKPQNLMTSYNKINGVWGHYCFELVETILRKEWGYEGNVMTDWWMRKSESPEFRGTKDQAYRIRSGVDLLMPGGGRFGIRIPDGSFASSLRKKDGLTLGEAQRSAKNILSFVMHSMAMNRIK